MHGEIMTAIEQLHVIVKGRVQGVSFRYYTRQQAFRLGISGWIRNNADGTVEVLAQGTREHLEELLDFLHVGSPSARVTDIDVEWSPATEPLDRFSIRYPTATQ